MLCTRATHTVSIATALQSWLSVGVSASKKQCGEMSPVGKKMTNRKSFARRAHQLPKTNFAADMLKGLLSGPQTHAHAQPSHKDQTFQQWQLRKQTLILIFLLNCARENCIKTVVHTHSLTVFSDWFMQICPPYGYKASRSLHPAPQITCNVAPRIFDQLQMSIVLQNMCLHALGSH